MDVLEWCGLLVDYRDVYISCLDSHSDGTHSLQSRGGSRGGARGAPAPVEIWLAPEVPLSCQSSLIYIKLAASVRRLKINLLNGFCLQLLVLCFQSRSSSPLREVPIQKCKVKKHIMVDVI